jgi:competence protein ComFC
MSSLIAAFYDSILTLIYPRACQICRSSIEEQSTGFACAGCWRDTRIFNGNETLCNKCGAFLLDTPQNWAVFCRRCDQDFYDSARAVGAYEKALLVSILELKRTPFVPRTLNDLVFQVFSDSRFQDANLLVPVPLSAKRLAERGFNQAELLARSLAVRTGLTLDQTSLRRRLHSEKSRRGMDRKSRMESVKNAFEVISPRLVEGKKILLIDDVFTSGATVSNCAKALKKAGAEKVYVLTVARAV